MNFEQLSKPFPPGDVEWRAGATNQDKTQAMALAYITSRAVMNRLDEVVGPDNWQDEYKAAPSGGVMCGISIRVNGEWVTKWDVGENTDFEAIKGGFSDAFKRAAVKWGIGRYLYSVDAVWVRCEARGKSIVLKETPKLPAWAIPGVQPLQPAASAKAPVSPPAENAPDDEKPETVTNAENVVNSKGVRYGDHPTDKLVYVISGINKALVKDGITDEETAELKAKRTAAETIIAWRNTRADANLAKL